MSLDSENACNMEAAVVARENCLEGVGSLSRHSSPVGGSTLDEESIVVLPGRELTGPLGYLAGDLPMVRFSNRSLPWPGDLLCPGDLVLAS